MTAGGRWNTCTIIVTDELELDSFESCKHLVDLLYLEQNPDLSFISSTSSLDRSKPPKPYKHRGLSAIVSSILLRLNKYRQLTLKKKRGLKRHHPENDRN